MVKSEIWQTGGELLETASIECTWAIYAYIARVNSALLAHSRNDSMLSICGFPDPVIGERARSMCRRLVGPSLAPKLKSPVTPSLEVKSGTGDNVIRDSEENRRTKPDGS